MSDPFVLAEAVDSSIVEDLPILREYAWDFAHDTFIYNDNGHHKIVKENEALKVWIYKCLKTERYRYQAYMHGEYNNIGLYGIELEPFIGRYSNTQVNGEKIKSYIRQGLLVNPYIEKINEIEISLQEKDQLLFVLDITSIYGDMVQEVTV